MRAHNFAILTSGGDAPGLNACINAIMHACDFYHHKLFGIEMGFEGLIQGRFLALELSNYGNLNSLGGTILKTSRSQLFKTEEGRHLAYLKLKERRLNKLIVIGGDGSLEGARIFTNEYPEIAIIGIPKTIDNDISDTDFSIGYDTALNTAVKAIDSIRDTAISHNRIFIIEVMGRDAGYIAYDAGLATAADGILIPETTMDFKYLLNKINQYTENNPLVIIVAEGDETGGAFSLSRKLKELLPKKEIKISILGYIQRGGSPSAFDRILATKLGILAVQSLIEGKSNVMIGFIGAKIKLTPLSQIHKRKMNITRSALEVLEICTKTSNTTFNQG